MPTYTYQCQNCGKEIDKIVKMVDMHEPEKEPCEDCQGTMKKIITSVLFRMDTGAKVVPDWYNDRLKQMKKRYPDGSTNLDNHIKR